MCCARCRRSESIPLTMPRISSKSDGAGAGARRLQKPGLAACLVETIRSAIPTAGESELNNDQPGRELPLAFTLRLREGLAGGDASVIRLLLSAAIALPCFGCASVTRGTTENISISTTPAGATADISGLEIPTACVTPCVVQAKRNADITVTINKEGYEPQIIPLTKEIPGTGPQDSRAIFWPAA